MTAIAINAKTGIRINKKFVSGSGSVSALTATAKTRRLIRINASFIMYNQGSNWYKNISFSGVVAFLAIHYSSNKQSL